jgi:hypothetical protein
VNSFTSALKSTPTPASRVRIIMACARTIHMRRRPSRSDDRTSTNGPYAHLKAHGRYSDATNAPISATPSPWRRICAATAVAVKPSGMPSVTYRRKNVERRPHLLESSIPRRSSAGVAWAPPVTAPA